MVSSANGPGSDGFTIEKDRAVQATGTFIAETICVSEQRDGCAPAGPR
jgi:hypothetical protein